MLSILSKKCSPTKSTSNNVKKKFFCQMSINLVHFPSTHPISAQDSDEENILDSPMEINFVQKKEPATSITTVKCKIKRLKIPAMALDSCAELPIVIPDIVEHVGMGWINL